MWTFKNCFSDLFFVLVTKKAKLIVSWNPKKKYEVRSTKNPIWVRKIKYNKTLMHSFENFKEKYFSEKISKMKFFQLFSSQIMSKLLNLTSLLSSKNAKKKFALRILICFPPKYITFCQTKKKIIFFFQKNIFRLKKVTKISNNLFWGPPRGQNRPKKCKKKLVWAF